MFESDFYNEQKAEEERLRRERLDAEFARSIQDGTEYPAMSPPSRSGPSAFDRMSGTHTSAPSSSASRAMTPHHGAPARPRKLPPSWNKSSSNTSGSKSEPQTSASSGITAEASSSRTVPGAFPEDISSDSDLELIEPSAFHDNGRHPRSHSGISGTSASVYSTSQGKTPRPSFSPEAQTAGTAALRRLDGARSTGYSTVPTALQMAMYGEKGGPKWMTNPTYGPQSIATANNSAQSIPLPPVASPVVANSDTVVGPMLQAGGSMVYPNAAAEYGSSSTGGLNSALGTYMGLPGFGVPAPGLGHPLEYGGTTYQELIRRAENDEGPSGIYQGPFDPAMADRVEYIMNDPRKTLEEINALLENIKPDEDLPPEDREGTPDGLKYPLVSCPNCIERNQLTQSSTSIRRLPSLGSRIWRKASLRVAYWPTIWDWAKQLALWHSY